MFTMNSLPEETLESVIRFLPEGNDRRNFRSAYSRIVRVHPTTQDTLDVKKIETFERKAMAKTLTTGDRDTIACPEGQGSRRQDTKPARNCAKAHGAKIRK